MKNSFGISCMDFFRFLSLNSYRNCFRNSPRFFSWEIHSRWLVEMIVFFFHKFLHRLLKINDTAISSETLPDSLLKNVPWNTSEVSQKSFRELEKLLFLDKDSFRKSLLKFHKNFSEFVPGFLSFFF